MENVIDVIKKKKETDRESPKFRFWCERRYLTGGARRKIASKEIQQVTELLTNDIGLRVHRKRNCFSETFVPMRSQVHSGIVVEMVEKTRSKA